MMPAPFADRLAAARRSLGCEPPDMPAAEVDQLAAAGRDVTALTGALLPALRATDPGAEWQRADVDAGEDRLALLLAALAGTEHVCWHLRRRGPQPVIVALALHRADCRRCTRTTRRLVTAPDECDLCGTTGMEQFTPITVTAGPALIVGDVCSLCAHGLGIDKGVGSSLTKERMR